MTKIETYRPGGELFTPIMYSALMKRTGPFVFVMGTAGVDAQTGRIARGLEDLPKDVRLQLASGNIHKDTVEGPILAQSWVMYRNLKRFLEEAGSSLDHMLHTIVFLRNERETWVPFDRVRQMMVKDPPPSMAIEMPGLGVSKEMLVQMFVIAGTAEEPGAILTERLTPDGELKARRLYGAGIKRMGPLVFAMGTGGVEPGTRRVIRGLDDVPADVRAILSSGDERTDGIQGRVMAQTWVGYQNVKRYLEGGGASLDDLMDEIVMLRDMKVTWPAFDRVRRLVLKNPPASTVVETPRLGITDDLVVEIHAVGGVPGAGAEIKSIPRPGVHSASAKRIGNIVFATATGGTDPMSGKPVCGLDDLPEAVRRELRTGDMFGDELHGPMLAQSWLAFETLGDSLRKAGSSLDSTLQALVFMKNTRENWPAFDRVFRTLVKDPPAVTLVETGYLGANDGCLLELHITAAAGDQK